MLILLIITNCLILICAGQYVYPNNYNGTSNLVRRKRALEKTKLDIKQFPFMVSIEKSKYNFEINVFHCTGIIVSKKLVLTVARCMKQDTEKKGTKVGNKYENMWVRAGSSNLHKDGVVATIEKVIVHPWVEMYGFDVALVVLKHPLKYTMAIQPATFATKYEMDINMLEAASLVGFVYNSQGNYLKEISNMNILSNEQCNHITETAETNPKHLNAWFLCTATLKVCEDNFGAALIQGNRVYAISLYIFGGYCHDNDNPHIYIRIASIRDWFEHYINLELPIEENQRKI